MKGDEDAHAALCYRGREMEPPLDESQHSSSSPSPSLLTGRNLLPADRSRHQASALADSDFGMSSSSSSDSSSSDESDDESNDDEVDLTASLCDGDSVSIQRDPAAAYLSSSSSAAGSVSASVIASVAGASRASTLWDESSAGHS